MKLIYQLFIKNNFFFNFSPEKRLFFYKNYLICMLKRELKIESKLGDNTRNKEKKKRNNEKKK